MRHLAMPPRVLLAAIAAGAGASAVAEMNAAGKQCLPAAMNGLDAELIALCNAFGALEVRSFDFYSGGAAHIEDDDERERTLRPLRDKQDELFEQFEAMQATTLEGFQARVRAMLIFDPDLIKPGQMHGMSECMIGALLRDMIGINPDQLYDLKSGEITSLILDKLWDA